MKTNKQLALIVADRVRDIFEEQLMEAVQDVTTDLLEEEGIDLDDDGWEIAMDVASRIYLGAQ